MYALADCNNFFVSCERVFRPDLWNKPVIVLSGNDGCVISRSNEVKALGIKMGAPLYQIKPLVEKYQIACFSSNFALYGDLSARVMSLLRKHTMRFEQYSIDEGFISVDHIPADEQKVYCEKIVKEIFQGVGIPISMGIAPTKTLAKVASKYAKKYPGYNGACIIDSEEKRRKALANFEISDVWGIGRKATARLQSVGINTALQFADKTEEYARNVLHKPGMLTWRELNGIDCINSMEVLEKQSITISRTFATAITEWPLMEQQLSNFCDACARKLRLQHSVCSQIVVYAHTSRFRTDFEPIYSSVVVNLAVPTANTQELLSAALSAFQSQFRNGSLYKKAGIILTHIIPEENIIPDLFDARDREKDSRLQKTLDMIRDKCGQSAILLTTQLPLHSDNQPQIYKQEHKSQLYTTDISQIVTIKS